MSVPLEYWLVLAVVLFGIGAIGVVTRRNVLIVLMSIELMLNAANLTFLAFSRARGDTGGHAVVFMVMAVAAAELAVGLALAVALFRQTGTAHIDRASEMKG